MNMMNTGMQVCYGNCFALNQRKGGGLGKMKQTNFNNTMDQIFGEFRKIVHKEYYQAKHVFWRSRLASAVNLFDDILGNYFPNFRAMQLFR